VPSGRQSEGLNSRQRLAGLGWAERGVAALQLEAERVLLISLSEQRAPTVLPVGVDIWTCCVVARVNRRARLEGS